MNELAEVNEFIDGFKRKDLEYKWGLAKDDSLDGDVKVTIIASGFGLVQEDIEEDSEEGINRDELRNRYYGKTLKPRSKPRTPVYIFKPEDLNNELLIDQIEAIPTARRSREQLVKLKEFTQQPNA
jgi:cell division protein FtsZ